MHNFFYPQNTNTLIPPTGIIYTYINNIYTKQKNINQYKLRVAFSNKILSRGYCRDETGRNPQPVTCNLVAFVSLEVYPKTSACFKPIALAF